MVDWFNGRVGIMVCWRVRMWWFLVVCVYWSMIGHWMNRLGLVNPKVDKRFDVILRRCQV